SSVRVGTHSPPAAPSTPEPFGLTYAQPAIRSTPASRRSSTPEAAWPGSRRGTPRSSGTAAPARTHQRQWAGAVVVSPRCSASDAHGLVGDPKSGREEQQKMFEAVEALVQERAELERQLADPAIHTDQQFARRLGQRFTELGTIVRAYREWQQACGDLEAARELACDDPSSADEAEKLRARTEELAEELRRLLVPRDPADSKDAMFEIKAGAGGEESALFAGDLLRMYLRFAERRGWRTELIDATETGLGGYKSVTLAIKAKGTPEPGEAPYAQLKYEGGVHRVQRVPLTESQGRIHTSAAGVLVMPEAEEIDVEIHDNDLRIDVYRSSGPGGQSVNTTDSAVR